MTNSSNTLTVLNEQTKASPKALKKIGDRLGFNYVVLKSLKKSQKNDVVKCFYMKSISKFGFCVIKEGSINDAIDKYGRDIKERLVWQQNLHQRLQGKVRIPGLIDTFEENGNFYLVIEYIYGKSLAHFLRTNGEKIRQGLIDGTKYGLKIVNYLIRSASALQCLHNLGIVHRDASANNFIISNGGKVYLIDFELSYSIDVQMPTPPYLLGTHGYMSPQQLAIKTPTIKEDVFAFGAILLHAWSNLSPINLTEPLPEDLFDRISYFIKDEKILNLIISCLSKEPSSRPNMSDIVEVLNEYTFDIKQNKKRVLTTVKELSVEDISRIIQSTIDTLAGPVLSDADKGWFAQDLKTIKKENGSLLPKGWYASFSMGGCGILYFLSKARMLGYDVSKSRSNIDKLISLIDERYYQYETPRSGLHSGCHGVAVSLAYAIDSGILENNSQWIEWIQKFIMQENRKTVDIVNGLSGQVLAGLIIYNLYPTEDLKGKIASAIKFLIDSQAPDGSWDCTIKNKKGKDTIINGFAFGVAGIVYTLLEYGRQFNAPATLVTAEKGLAWLIRNAKWSGSSVHWVSPGSKKPSLWWEDGASGIILCFLKAYELTKSTVYKKYCQAALVSFSDNFWDSNFSQARGIAGLGEIYIEAYMIFKERIWLTRANTIAQMLMKSIKVQSGLGSYWLTEHQFVVPGFMVGNAGTLHFLLRLLNYQKVGVPMTVDAHYIGIKEPYPVSTENYQVVIHSK